MRSSGWRLALGTPLLLLATFRTGIDAHKGITSKYTYNEDVYPILRERCGACHAEGGPTPMSLLTYQDNGGAVAWAESIREMLLSEAMPPWYVDPTGPSARNSHTLTPRELDVVVTWATGGTPQGDPQKKPGPSRATAQWSLGAPDATLTLQPQTLAAGTMEATVDMTVATGFRKARWLKAVDLLPGTPSIVRQATISIAGGQTLAVWQPGDNAIGAPDSTAFRVPAGARLHARIRYKKGWQDEQSAKSDTSTIGLYLADEPRPGKSIETIAIDGQVGTAAFGGAMTRGGRILAVRPQVDQPYRSMAISATTPSGQTIALLKLRGIRPEWPRRYWLNDPVELPRGTKIDVVTVPGDPDAGSLGPRVESPLGVSLDLVAP